MISHTLATILKGSAARFLVVTLTAPGLSGKATLLRAVFKDHEYMSSGLPDRRDFAVEDPRGFLIQFGGAGNAGDGNHCYGG